MNVQRETVFWKVADPHGSELHQKISLVAELNGVSLNQFICDSLEKAVGGSLLPVEAGKASRKIEIGAKKTKQRREQPSRRHRKVRAGARRAKIRTK